MFKKIRKISIFIVAALAAMMLLCCGRKSNAADNGTTHETSREISQETTQSSAVETAVIPKAEETKEQATAVAYAPKNPDNRIDESGYYYDVENVVLYIHTYGKLPANYITKKEAKALGWEGGSVEQVMPDAAIGGDHYGNYEGMLPEAAGREYTECDIDTHGYKNRGSRRLIFSNDGLYFYTPDHYESFQELYVTDEGVVEWK